MRIIAQARRRKTLRRRVAAVLVVTALVLTGVALTAGGLADPHPQPPQDPGLLDTDGDGLSADAEMSGWRTQDGDVFVTDPTSADSDGDGLSDGEEAGAMVTDPHYGAAYVGISDPRSADTDGDGIGDGDEYFLDLNPRLPDTDEDGLLDDLELEFGSDPTLANADDDGYTDKEEYDRDSDPLAYDLDRTDAIAAFAAGAAVGDWESIARLGGMSDEQLESPEYLAGQFASGVLGVGDLRDFTAAAARLDVVGAVTSAVALVPGAGDSTKAAELVTKFATRGDRAERAAYSFVERLPWSTSIKRRVLDKVFGGAHGLPKRLEGGPKSCVVYAARSTTGSIPYIGITNDLARRQAQHGGRFAIAPISGADGLWRGACRAVEEALIKRGGLRADGGVLENKIHSISPTADDYDAAVEYGERLLDDVEFVGLPAAG